MTAYSAIVLAGGDGTRLQALTRARLLVEADRLLTVVTRHHERFYTPLLADAPPRTVIVQPENRGTATAIVLALLRLRGVGAEGPVDLGDPARGPARRERAEPALASGMTDLAPGARR